MFQFISMVREAFPITSFIPVPGMKEMEALGNSTAVMCILENEGDKGEKRKGKVYISRVRVNAKQDSNFSQTQNAPGENTYLEMLYLRLPSPNFSWPVKSGKWSFSIFCFKISSPTSLATGKQQSVQLPLILPGSL